MGIEFLLINEEPYYTEDMEAYQAILNLLAIRQYWDIHITMKVVSSISKRVTIDVDGLDEADKEDCFEILRRGNTRRCNMDKMTFTEDDIIRVVQNIVNMWKADKEKGYDVDFFKDSYKFYRFFFEDLTKGKKTLRVSDWKVYIKDKED